MMFGERGGHKVGPPRPAIWEGFCEGIPNIQAPVWWGSVLLKDYMGGADQILGVTITVPTCLGIPGASY